MKRYLIIFIVFTFFTLPVCAGSFKREYLEKDYQNAWCSMHSGATEIVLPDKARVDCVTSTHAIEFDFADKWGESIGQSLYYATVLGKKAGIVLIIEDKVRDERYLKRVQAVAKNHGITVWTTIPDDVLTYYGKFVQN